MPIKPENRNRYPDNWAEISQRIRVGRAGNRCEGSPAYPDCRAENGLPHPVTGSRVVLTVAHLNHTPEDCREENLRAMCQRCHLTYDRVARSAKKRGPAMLDTIPTKTKILPAGVPKKIWMGRDPLFNEGSRSPYVNVWIVECEGRRYRAYKVKLLGVDETEYHPEVYPGGPVGWIEFEGEVVVYTNTEM